MMNNQIFKLLLTILWIVIIYIFSPFTYELHIDEIRFLGTSAFFSKSWIPSEFTLKNYEDLNTPLIFIIWGWGVKIFGRYLFVGRLFNLALGIFICVQFLKTAKIDPTRAQKALIGLLIFPYFWFCSVFMYTDMIAVTLVMLGMRAYFNNSFVWMGIWFSLAVFSRQYMIEFPAAIGFFELIRTLVNNNKFRSFLGNIWERRLIYFGLLLPLATLLAWFLYLGAMAPKGELAEQNYTSNVLLDLHVLNMLFGLASAGAFCAVLEFILFKESRKENFTGITPLGLISMGLVTVLFLFFVPIKQPTYFLHGMDYTIENMGALHFPFQKLVPLMGNTGVYLEQFAYWLLAMICCQRFFSKINLMTFIAFFHFVLLLKTFWIWDKYNLPFVLVFWVMHLHKQPLLKIEFSSSFFRRIQTPIFVWSK